MNSRPSRDYIFMEVAKIIAQRSTCLRKKVGAVIVKDGRIVSCGYNGVPSGYPHCTECLGPGCDISVHAEMNAIAFAAKNGVKIDGSILYVTMAPCSHCAKVIINSGVSEVVCAEEYREKAVLGLNMRRL